MCPLHLGVIKYQGWNINLWVNEVYLKKNTGFIKVSQIQQKSSQKCERRKKNLTKRLTHILSMVFIGIHKSWILVFLAQNPSWRSAVKPVNSRVVKNLQYHASSKDLLPHFQKEIVLRKHIFGMGSALSPSLLWSEPKDSLSVLLSIW